MLTYYQETGELYGDNTLLGTGYSGFHEGKNNPMMQDERDVGPIPTGEYKITGVYDSPRTGPATIGLEPLDYTNTFGRTDFRIHGDSSTHPGEASHGCIIMPRAVRDQIVSEGHRLLSVHARK